MKKVVIIGAGSSGLITAAMMKNYWGDKVDVSVYYDKSNKNIAVGESTTPIIRLFLIILPIYCSSSMTLQFDKTPKLFSASLTFSASILVM